MPVTCVLRIYTDSLSAIQAINRGRVRDWGNCGRGNGTGYTNQHVLPERRRITCAGRALLDEIRRLVALRPHSVQLIHVRSHTGGDDRCSRLNDVADTLANEGRGVSAVMNIADLETRPAQLIMLCSGRVYGSYKGAMQRQVEGRLLKQWRALEHQGRLLRDCEGGALTLIKSAVVERDSRLVRFLILACCEWLPTERRLYVAGKDHGRGQQCKLCRQGSETNVHALLACPHTSAQRSLSATASEKAVLVAIGRGTPVPITRPLPAWYDPSGDLVVRAIPSKCRPDRLTAYLGHNPLADALGITPPGISSLLGLDGDSSERLRQCRTEIARGAMAVYESRCRALNDWWKSDAAKPHWNRWIRAGLKREVERAVKLARAKAERATQSFRKRHPGPQGSLRGTASLAWRLRPNPKAPDRGVMVTTTADEEIRDAAIDGLRGQSRGGVLCPRPLPWY